MNQKIELSIIIVAYRKPVILQRCLDSIPQREDWQTVVIDNSDNNRGFARGSNTGARQSTGKYLLFLNPDSVVVADAIEVLLDEISKDNQVGVVAPRLIDEKGESYLSYSRQPTWKNAWFVYSGLNKMFWWTQVVQKHWMVGLNDKKLTNKYSSSTKAVWGWWRDPVKMWQVPANKVDVGIVSGAALMMRKQDFIDLGGFDERFFMYWEEVDLCRRVIDWGKKIRYLPQASIMHSGGLLTPKDSTKVLSWFRDSRSWFLLKNFGWFKGVVIISWLWAQEEWRQVLIVLFFSFLLFKLLN